MAKKKLQIMISILTLFCMSFGMLNITGFAETDHSHNEISCEACGGEGSVTCEACNGAGKTGCNGSFEIDSENTTATCFESGSVAYKCAVCGASYTESNAFLHHEPTEVTVKTPATCTEKGEEECYDNSVDIVDNSAGNQLIPARGH